MTEPYLPVATLLSGVRSRWRRVVLFRGVARAALAASAILVILQVLAYWMPPMPMALAIVGAVAVLLAAGSIVWGLLPAREIPSDRRLARFVEECQPGLDQRLVTAVDVATARGEEVRPAFADLMISDAARVATSIDPAAIVSAGVLRQKGFQAAAASLLLVAVGFSGRHVGQQWWDALSLAIFPSRVVLEVVPGDVRLLAGANLTVEARLVGNSAPVVARLLSVPADAADAWSATEMTTDSAGRFTASFEDLSASFRYRVAAGSAISKIYSVAVARPPRAKRIDLEYTYPRALGLASRTEKDGGDIYAPEGTDVRLRVYSDGAAASGRLLLGGDQVVALAPDSTGGVLTGALKVTADGSYRLELADAEGLASRGDTEYFIRIMDDRPPEVHVVRPASDRRVTPLEEVEIEVEAADDFGIASLDLVYSVRGRADAVVPIRVPPNQTSVKSGRTLYLEDLRVKPGDFVSYYVRARDLARGKPSSESRSDIFFLEVRTFEEEFSLAQSQAAMGGGSSDPQLDDLVVAQKDIIVATWKLDRRAQDASGAKSAQDIRAVAEAESKLKTRVEQASSAFRTSAMRDPGGRATNGPTVRPGGPSPAPTARAVQARPEEAAMTAAAAALGTAATLLTALKTGPAIAPEMEALEHLLRAQAGVKKREIPQQQAGGPASADNRAGQDLSSLFDKELARSQETNYEPQTGGTQGTPERAPLDRVKELAQRQDELVQRQRSLASEKARMTPEEVKRELETLTREQNELQQRAEELAQQMAGSQPQDQAGQQPRPQNSAQQGGQPSGQQTGQSGQGGQQAGSQASRPDPAGQPEPSGRPPGQSAQASRDNQRMREISDEMRGAASDLRKQDADKGGTRSERALSQLRELERQLQNDSPDGQRRALGDLQLEARQLADAQRQIAAESAANGQRQNREDSLRRLAGEQDRLADRLQSVQRELKQQADPDTSVRGASPKEAEEAKALRQAAAEAGRELERQRLAERMAQSAEAMRGQADRQGDRGGSPAGAPESMASASPQAQEEIAKALDRIADRLATAGRAQDDDSRKATGQLARAQELRERLDDLNRRLEELAQAGQASGKPGQTPATGAPDRAAQVAPGGQTAQGIPQQAPGDAGKPGQGQSGSSGTSADLEQLRADVNREIEQVRELLDDTQVARGGEARGGSGRTFEGQGMTLSAPGTEGFKQDFAKWQELKQQATAALESVESTLARKLQEKESKDRLNAGADERAPAAYQRQVDDYFRALASRTNP